MKKEDLSKEALKYHKFPKPGKLCIAATKPMASQRDLSLAYSPGVAAACEEIKNDPQTARDYTSRGNLAAVITNGTAVLGLGDIGPLASKPVMEGKAVLFKKFADIDVFDIEVNEKDPDKFVDIVASLEPTFGAINLEDIKSPECFEIEKKLKERLNIPVFHDDQHGTAIIVAAAITNALKVVGKQFDTVKLVTSGAGAAAMACLDLLVNLGIKKDNIFVADRKGILYTGRPDDMDTQKIKYVRDTEARKLEDVMEGADIFLGLSAAGVLTGDMVKDMASQPIIMALANPVPEILPEEARKVRPDSIIATGRSDYPNQVNNVLCFPFIFRGALDVGAKTINDEMKAACVKAIAELATVEASDIVTSAYGDTSLSFGPDYLIPKPLDPRLISTLAPAVAQAAMDTGVATKPIEDMETYRHELSSVSFRTGLMMRPIFSHAKKDPKRVVFAEGEEERVLRAVQIAVDEGYAKPILIGRRDVLKMRIERYGLRIRLDEDVEICDPQDDPRYKEYWTTYHKLMARKGITPDLAKTIVRTNTTVIGALMVYLHQADALICGPVGRYVEHMRHLNAILRKSEEGGILASLNGMVLDSGVYFTTDAYINNDPSPEEIAEITLMAAKQVESFGIDPNIALLSHSQFGSSKLDSAQKMKKALDLIKEKNPNLHIDGEMSADLAIDPKARERVYPDSDLKGPANLFVMPSIDAANISYHMTLGLAKGQPVGPILLGIKKPAHIITTSSTVRGILNMTAIAVVQAQLQEDGPNSVTQMVQRG